MPCAVAFLAKPRPGPIVCVPKEGLGCPVVPLRAVVRATAFTRWRLLVGVYLGYPGEGTLIIRKTAVGDVGTPLKAFPANEAMGTRPIVVDVNNQLVIRGTAHLPSRLSKPRSEHSSHVRNTPSPVVLARSRFHSGWRVDLNRHAMGQSAGF